MWSVAALTALVLTAGTLVSLAVGSLLRDASHRTAVRAMDGRTDLMSSAVRTEIDRYRDQVQTLAAALGAMDEVTAARFARTTAPLRPMGLSGATSVVYLVPVANSDLAAVQAEWRRRGAADLVIRPHGHGPHVIGVLTTRLDGQRNAGYSGVDITQAPAPYAATTESRRSGSVAVSDTYHLIIDQQLPPSQRQFSFVLTAPVTGPDGRFRGWVMMGLRGQDFVQATLSRVAQNLVDVSLTARNADGRDTAVAGLSADRSGRRDLHRTVNISVAQRHWELRTGAVSAALPGASPSLAVALTATLLGVTLLAGTLVAILASGRRRAERRVQAATRELQDTEREAREQAELLGTVLHTITEGVGVVDSDGRFLAHNPAAKQLLGISLDSSGPDRWQQHYGLFRPDGSEPLPVAEMPLVRALNGEDVDGVEILVRNPARRSGALITVSARPLALADGSRGAVAVFHDVTEERAYEAELQGFAGVVAHDLKSPLTTVVGYAELLEDEVAGNDEALEHLGRIRATATRMRTLIDDLLTYTSARDAAINQVSFPLGDLVQEVVAARLHASRAGGYFPDVYVGRLPALNADPVLVRQVLENLIGNALKYTRPGSPARVDVTARLETEQRGGTWARVEISDRGIGIPAGEHGRVFDRFHRAHPTEGYPGTGLGLAICQRIVERHGGAIGATDNPGGGTRFWFTLPAGDDPAPRPPARLAQAASSGRSSSA
ncbi:PAS domain-containing protein [Cryptosporangium phraense]|uniref:Sensor-like histidine kinase SenX3 n=1 Tax=Cryptosporangium phraense TaxID=2593070 RepID=A0A545AVW6_9ACTN|nr:PAS domain-containing protein [Cryptosporangium phraense]